ncbi:hypothetical protein DSM104329_04732 [Capillimicrobium parvum]|uniref:Uncharacterized protein n=1 Tax=Capillimicrobium parvum TaxID=2884022 RepID=A0A9E7C397_9ACTN|nr:hypothetical protein DSM104329_04732 [Capillimicrobium parvum]
MSPTETQRRDLPLDGIRDIAVDSALAAPSADRTSCISAPRSPRRDGPASATSPASTTMEFPSRRRVLACLNRCGDSLFGDLESPPTAGLSGHFIACTDVSAGLRGRSPRHDPTLRYDLCMLRALVTVSTLCPPPCCDAPRPNSACLELATERSGRTLTRRGRPYCRQSGQSACPMPRPGSAKAERHLRCTRAAGAAAMADRLIHCRPECAAYGVHACSPFRARFAGGPGPRSRDVPARVQHAGGRRAAPPNTSTGAQAGHHPELPVAWALRPPRVRRPTNSAGSNPNVLNQFDRPALADTVI